MGSFFKDSPDLSHSIFEINLRGEWIRHTATVILNDYFYRGVTHQTIHIGFDLKILELVSNIGIILNDF